MIDNLCEALRKANWEGVSIGNKALIWVAILNLESLQNDYAELRERYDLDINPEGK